METPEFSEHGVAPAGRPDAAPHGRTFPARIDDTEALFHEQLVSGADLLAAVDKQPCAYTLIQLLPHDAAQVIAPDSTVDLGQPGAKRFVTQARPLVDVYINKSDHPAPYQVAPGTHTVAEILTLAGQGAEGYDLFIEQNGALVPLAATAPVIIAGCEEFHSQVKTGASS